MSSMEDDTSFMLFPAAQKFSSVKNSMSFLSNTVTTPLPYLRQQQQQQQHQQQQRYVDYTPSSVLSHSMFDVSDTSGHFASGSILFTPSTKATLGGSTLLATPGTSLAHSIFGQTIDEELTMGNTDTALGDDPVETASQAVYSEFAASYRSAVTQHEVFEPLSRYEQICQQNVSVLKNLVKRTVHSHPSCVEMWIRLKLEKQTWRLVSSLYRDRIDTENQLTTTATASDDNAMVLDVTVKHTSEKKLMSTLFEQDATLRQAQLVVDWLEDGAYDMLEDFYNKVDFHIDKMGAWENTLHMLKQKKEHGSRLAALHTFVDQLDPDAPLRQAKQLLDLDIEDDVRLLHYVFACIRAGQMDEAHRVCEKVGQTWRAATLNGWHLYHDLNMEELGPGGTVQRIEGNQYRDIWKKTCWKASEDGRLPAIERAIYAALCGNLRQLLPCLVNWHDYLWAYFKVMVEQIVETHIRTSFTGPRRLVAMPTTHNDDAFTIQRIFAELQCCPNETIQKQCKNPFYLIQKYIITADISSLVEEMYEWCQDEMNPPHQHLLRFMAHLVLFLRSIGVTSKEELCTIVLESYVKLLIDQHQVDLVATYVATLPRNSQVEWYARFLEGVRENNDRRHCLQLAERCGLDVEQITKLVVENIRSTSNFGFSDVIDSDLTLEATTTEEDKLKIDGLDWLLFYPVQRSEALRQANAIMRVFLASRKLPACRQIVRKIPHDTYDVMLSTWRTQSGEEELSAQDANAFREFLCIRAYLDAQESFTDWFSHYYNSRPKPPEIALSAGFNERIAYEQKQRTHEAELDRWQHSLDLQTKSTVDKIYNVLLFIDGGWMVDSHQDGAVDEDRARQMLLLRQLCIPPMCTLLYQVLHTAKRYKECIQIGEYIASEHQLFKAFSATELQDFQKRIRDLSDTLQGPLV